jgi:hypothetical protein
MSSSQTPELQLIRPPWVSVFHFFHHSECLPDVCSPFDHRKCHSLGFGPIHGAAAPHARAGGRLPQRCDWKRSRRTFHTLDKHPNFRVHALVCTSWTVFQSLLGSLETKSPPRAHLPPSRGIGIREVHLTSPNHSWFCVSSTQTTSFVSQVNAHELQRLIHDGQDNGTEINLVTHAIQTKFVVVLDTDAIASSTVAISRWSLPHPS